MSDFISDIDINPNNYHLPVNEEEQQACDDNRWVHIYNDDATAAIAGEHIRLVDIGKKYFGETEIDFACPVEY